VSSIPLSEAWKQEALNWAAWAREPGLDSYWKFHRDQFLQLLPAPVGQTVDVGCGEGRLVRDLTERGYKVCGVDVSDKLIELAKQSDPEGTYKVGNASRLPLEDGYADLVVSFMCLHDVDDLGAAMLEIARILKPGSKACISIVHPLNSAGKFSNDSQNSEFIIEGSYLDESRYAFPIERNGLSMTFHSQHRSIEAFSRAFENAGLLIDAIREHRVPDAVAHEAGWKRWQRVPMFMHMRLVKPQR
jgi:SAM-dependent methyltransferase